MAWIASLGAGLLWLQFFGVNLASALWLPLGWTVWAALTRHWLWLSISLLVPGLGLGRRQPRPGNLRTRRRQLIELWAMVGLYLTAGMDLWSAVEEAVAIGPLVGSEIREFSHRIAVERDPVEAIAEFCARIPGPESEVVATMIHHGYHHGIATSDVIAQAGEMEDHLAFESELQRRQDPLWLTIIPAVMLLNVLAVFAMPMAVTMLHSWHGI